MALPRTLAGGLSDTQLTALRPTGKSFDVADPAVPGLLLRIGPKGAKLWLFRFEWRHMLSRVRSITHEGHRGLSKLSADKPAARMPAVGV